MTTHVTVSISPLARDHFLCFQELDIHRMESCCCDSQIGGGEKASTMTRRRERSLPKAHNPSNAQVQNWSFRKDLERAGNGRRRGKRVQDRESLRQKGQIG